MGRRRVFSARQPTVQPRIHYATAMMNVFAVTTLPVAAATVVHRPLASQSVALLCQQQPRHRHRPRSRQNRRPQSRRRQPRLQLLLNRAVVVSPRKSVAMEFVMIFRTTIRIVVRATTFASLVNIAAVVSVPILYPTIIIAETVDIFVR